MRPLYVILFWLLIIPLVYAQKQITNVRLSNPDSARIEILYDLLSNRLGDSIYVEIVSRVRGPLQISPQFIKGDVGLQIPAKLGHRIIWNAQASGVTLREEIKATVLIKNRLAASAAPSPPYRSKGPGWALLSTVAPGTGNIFVQVPKPKIGFRPLLTVGCYGLVIYGLLEQQKAQANYALYDQQLNIGADESIYQTANDQHKRYIIATGGALIIAATDVILTFFKGLHNHKLYNKARHSPSILIRPGFQAGYPTAILSHTF